MPHLVVQRSPCIAVPEPLCQSYWSLWALESVLPNERATARRSLQTTAREETLLSAAGEKPGHAHKGPPELRVNKLIQPFLKRSLVFTFKVKKIFFELLKTRSMWQLRLLVTINIKQLMKSKTDHHSPPTHSHPFTPPSPRKQTRSWTLAVSHVIPVLRSTFPQAFNFSSSNYKACERNRIFGGELNYWKSRSDEGTKNYHVYSWDSPTLRVRNTSASFRQTSFLMALGQTFFFKPSATFGSYVRLGPKA